MYDFAEEGRCVGKWVRWGRVWIGVWVGVWVRARGGGGGEEVEGRWGGGGR